MKTLLLSILMLPSLAAALPVTIDDFTTGTFAIEDTTIDGSSVTSIDGGAGIIGGERDAFVELKNRLFGVGDARLEVGGGVMSFSTDAGASGTAVLQYDGIDGSPVLDVDGLGSVDFTAGASGFNLDIIFSDAGFDFQVNTFWDGGMSSNTANFTSIGFPLSGTRFIGFDDPEFGTTDFSDISAFELIVDPLGEFAALDLAMVNIGTNEVPAPGAPVLLGLGLGLLGMARVLRK